MKRIILLVDMDAFFTSCEEVRNQSLRGKPVAVGADPKAGHGRGVVSTANYEARKYGIHSAMPISIAYRKCPNCIFLPVDMNYYVGVSRRVMQIMKRYADKFEQVSVDEAYLDVSSKGTLEKARDVAHKIKKEIFDKEKITCSVGIGPNKLIAKMAAGHRKPNGLTIVTPAGVKKFMEPLGVRELYGVGPKTEQRLKELEIETIGQLAKTSLKTLKAYFGESFGAYLHEASRGIDESPVEEGWIPKSSGRQVTFENDTKDGALIEKTMDDMIDDSFAELRAEGFKSYKTVTIKVRYEDFETHTKAKTLTDRFSTPEPAKSVAKNLLRDFLMSKKKIRLVGVSLSKLES